MLGGTGNGVQWVAVVTALQEATPIDLQARVVGLLESLGAAMPGVGFLLGGALTTVAIAADRVRGRRHRRRWCSSCSRWSCGASRLGRPTAAWTTSDAPQSRRRPTVATRRPARNRSRPLMPLDHVALTVSDRERSAAFYGEHFGLTERVHDDEQLLILGDGQGSLLALSRGAPPPVELLRTQPLRLPAADRETVLAARERFRSGGASTGAWSAQDSTARPGSRSSPGSPTRSTCVRGPYGAS